MACKLGHDFLEKTGKCVATVVHSQSVIQQFRQDDCSLVL